LPDTRRDDPRLDLLRHWLESSLGFHDFDLAPASADASFRRYFRVTRAQGSVIVMDAPPGKEDVGPYLRVAQMLEEAGVHAPHIIARNAELGFLLLSDLGATTYLDALRDPDRAEPLYRDAIAALVKFQSNGRGHCAALPPYDERLLRTEMRLFPEWLVSRHLGVDADGDLGTTLAAAADLLVANALEQPQVFVHRDYHSRNLMVCEGANPGILDFQDAVHGALTYDLVSLLRDCYVAWPQERVLGWVRDYRRLAANAGLETGADEERFLRWFDLMGIQRHLKAAGIFARLWHRDDKPGYLPDVPRTLNYIVEACARHEDLHALGALVRERVLPAMVASLEARRA
jgi:aminoglycoside/choline kinase family phosphotransferase